MIGAGKEYVPTNADFKEVFTGINIDQIILPSDVSVFKAVAKKVLKSGVPQTIRACAVFRNQSRMYEKKLIPMPHNELFCIARPLDNAGQTEAQK